MDALDSKEKTKKPKYNFTAAILFICLVETILLVVLPGLIVYSLNRSTALKNQVASRFSEGMRKHIGNRKDVNESDVRRIFFLITGHSSIGAESSGMYATCLAYYLTNYGDQLDGKPEIHDELRRMYDRAISGRPFYDAPDNVQTALNDILTLSADSPHSDLIREKLGALSLYAIEKEKATSTLIYLSIGLTVFGVILSAVSIALALKQHYMNTAKTGADELASSPKGPNA